MALVKKSTWRSLTHSVGNITMGMSDGLAGTMADMAAGVNDSLNESMRDDIPVDETELERLQREQEEQEAREQEAQELQDDIEWEREEQERLWQEEQDRILQEEAQEPGMLSKAYDAFRDSSFYAGYTGVRNMVIGGAMIGAGLGLTGTAGLATAAALPIASTSIDMIKWAQEKFQRDTEANSTEISKAEAEAENGVPKDQLSEKLEPGDAGYANIEAKARTNDQKITQETALQDDSVQAGQSGAGKVDPEYVKATAEELVAGIQAEPPAAFDFDREM